MEALRETVSHPSAAWIFDRVKNKCPHISLGTVYRNLNILKAAGMIREIKFGKSTARYDGNVELHHHILCLDCGKLEDVMCSPSLELMQQVKQSMEYTVSGYEIEFKGICPECLQQTQKARGDLNREDSPVDTVQQ